jgi:hypothetical protein
MSYILEDAVKETVLEKIQDLDISYLGDNHNNHNNHTKINSDIISFLISKGIVKETEIDFALEQAVITDARRSYHAIVRGLGFYKDDPDITDIISNPSSFAYAIDKGFFSKEEIEKIPFNKGDTAESWKNRYLKKDYIPKLREKLISPPLEKKYSLDDSDRPHSEGW